MPRLAVSLDYTNGSAGKYAWLREPIRTCLRQLGIEATIDISEEPIRISSEGALSNSNLHSLTKNIIEKSTIRKDAERGGDWFIHMLIASRHNQRFLGVMYDSAYDSRQRQGCAVFEDEVAALAGGIIRDKQIILQRTTLHEIGHCLNLIHRSDRTLMAQTETIRNTDDWISRIVFNYANDDRNFVTVHPNESRPGGFGTRAGAQADSFSKYGLKKLAISINDIRPGGRFRFKSGVPVSLMIRLTNKSGRDVALALPLNIYSENIRIWIKRPGGKFMQIKKAVAGCGSLLQPMIIGPGDFRMMPLHLFSDNKGYLFHEPGLYSIRVGVREHGRGWLISPAKKLTITSVAKNEQKLKDFLTTGIVAKFFELGGHSKKSLVPHLKKMIHKHPGSELNRPLYWALSSIMKLEVFEKAKTTASQKKKARELRRLYDTMVAMEISPVNKGKLIQDRQRLIKAGSSKTIAVNAKEKKSLKAYEIFKKKQV
jgi:hypothetical protein